MATLNLSTSRPTLRFGAYELDRQMGMLRKNGVRLRCQEQPLQVLAALAERPGELVTREELRQRVWPEDTFVDFDHALNTAIKKIRATLNDDADAPRYIETVPRRGYRFLAQVERDGATHPGIRVPAEPPSPPFKSRRRLSVLVVGAVVLAVLIGWAWRLAPWRATDVSTPPEFQRLTFDLPELGDARFTPDGASVVYSAGGRARLEDIYTQRLSASTAQSLGMPNSVLLSVSRQGELAVLAEKSAPMFDLPYWTNAGTLARVPPGGAPRPLLPDVEAADWSPDGQLAVVRQAGHRSRLEFPVGKVLYETFGWLASPRFSPAGDFIAVLDHPVVPDDRGSVVIIGVNGAKRARSRFWESVRGLAWAPNGNEVWFAGARSGVSRTLYAMNVTGRERAILSVAGGVTLQDISRDGRVLLDRDNEQLGIMFVGPGATQPKEMSWKDWSIAEDISADGKQILFGEEGENSGFSYEVGLRPTDGSQPVILGPGAAQSLSPDGKWALSLMPPPDNQMVLLPTGPGVPKALPRGSVEQYKFDEAKWFPDARHIAFAGYESGHGPRCYMQSIDGGNPRAFTPDGITFCSVSPTGRILALSEDHRALLYASASSEKPEKELHFETGEVPNGWSSDGKFLYLSQSPPGSLTITRYDVDTGRRQVWKQMTLPAPNAQLKCEALVITPDGRSFAYTYSRHLSDLYLVQGLR